MYKFKKSLLPLFFLIAFCISANGQQINSAEKVLDSAFQEAGLTGKNVLIVFSASWCVNCHILIDSLLEFKNSNYDYNKLFHDNYVIKYLITAESKGNKHLENPGADKILTEYNSGHISLPFFVILDSKGKVLKDSYMDTPKGRLHSKINIGRPYSKDEVNYFLDILRITSKLSETELIAIKRRCNPEL